MPVTVNRQELDELKEMLIRYGAGATPLGAEALGTYEQYRSVGRMPHDIALAHARQVLEDDALRVFTEWSEDISRRHAESPK